MIYVTRECGHGTRGRLRVGGYMRDRLIIAVLVVEELSIDVKRRRSDNRDGSWS